MTITVDDPGFKDGQIVPMYRRYEITLSREGKIFKRIEVSAQLYHQLVALYFVAHGLVTGLMIWSGMLTWEALNSWVSPGGIILFLQLLHLAISFRAVAADRVGGLLFFGRPVKLVSAGLIFVPWGLFQLTTLPRSPVQVQFPGDPEKIYRDSDKEYFKLSEEERQRLVLPIRAITGGPETEGTGSEKNVLDTQMTIEPSFFVRFTVDYFWVFLVRIGDIEEAIRQLRDTGEMVIIEQVASRSPRKIIAELRNISESLRKKLEEATEDWGVMIDEAAMLSPDIGKTVNVALQDITVAKATASKTVITAEATKKQLTLEGQGAAAAKEAELSALAEGQKKMGVSGQDVLDLEKARALAQGKTTIFVDGGQGANLLGIGARLAAGANTTKPDPTQQ